MRTIYLAGGMFDCTDSEMKDWREQVKKELDGLFLFRDPTVRDYRGNEDRNVTAIVEEDKKDIAASDIILVMGNTPSWGTAMEVIHSHSTGRFVITICEATRVSPWLRYHSHLIVPDVDEAIKLLKVT